MSTHVTAMDCTVCKTTHFENCEHKGASKPHTSREVLQSSSKLHSFLILPKPRAQLPALRLSSESLFLRAPHVICVRASFRHCCWLALVLLLLSFKADPGVFLIYIFIKAYIGVVKSQNVQN